PLAQTCFQMRLMEVVIIVPALIAESRMPITHQQRLPFRVNPVHAVAGTQDRQHVLGKASTLKYSHCFAIDMDSARNVQYPFIPLKNDHGQTVTTEQIGQSYTGRTGADDGNVIDASGVMHALIVVRWVLGGTRLE